MLKKSDRIVWIEDGLITKVTTSDAIDIQVEEVH
jgi:hypothetical protein